MKIQWSKLTTAERDALIAEKVMGWKTGEPFRLTEGEYFTRGSLNEPDVWTIHVANKNMLVPFSPSSSIADAFQVVTKMNGMGRVWFLDQSKDLFWNCAFVDQSDSENKKNAGGSCRKAAGEAICIAALRAVGIEVEE